MCAAGEAPIYCHGATPISKRSVDIRMSLDVNVKKGLEILVIGGFAAAAGAAGRAGAARGGEIATAEARGAYGPVS